MHKPERSPSFCRHEVTGSISSRNILSQVAIRKIVNCSSFSTVHAPNKQAVEKKIASMSRRSNLSVSDMKSRGTTSGVWGRIRLRPLNQRADQSQQVNGLSPVALMRCALSKTRASVLSRIPCSSRKRNVDRPCSSLDKR